ncbi:MAG: MoaD family protein [Candidatus Bipolaricaulota bacterium]|nr:MoaD family protein [Candidatus Bipolaricaulota bacterium]MDW8126890.1 ubiquitin-like small modifier protein 1 [Candidatus Bipolaricaulota bacterium]
MRVEVRLFGEFREVAGKPAVVLELLPGADCAKALEELVRCEPKLGDLLFSKGALRDHLHVFVNGQNVNHREGLRTKLSEGDVLTFFSPISGG